MIPLKGEVSQAQFFFLRRALKEAERENASAVILDMDTYGGELKAATRRNSDRGDRRVAASSIE